MSEAVVLRKFFIAEHEYKRVRHGGIGNVDIEKILIKMGYEPIRFPYVRSFGVYAKFKRLIFLFQMLRGLKKSIVVYQFPLHAILHRQLLRLLLNKKDVHVICHVADVNGLKDGEPVILRNETALLKRHRFFLVHNQSMLNWLKEIKPGAQAEIFMFFDFLAQTFNNKRTKSFDVVFAGNLGKSNFLSDLHKVFAVSDMEPVRFLLYGPGLQLNSTDRVIFKGAFEAYELPPVLEGSFGLVWDGDSCFGLRGSLGEYMKYISHHKLSLYILASLPMIVPAGSAAEQIVRQLDIGISVPDLSAIGKAIRDLTDEDYFRMQQNMKHLAQKIQAGDCLTEALLKLESKISEEN